MLLYIKITTKHHQLIKMMLTLSGVLEIPEIQATINKVPDGRSVTQIKVENQEHALAILEKIAMVVPLHYYAFKLKRAPKTPFVILDGKQIFL